MEKLKKSIIKLLNVSLTSVDFQKKGEALRRLRIPTNAIKIQVVINKIDSLKIRSECTINIYNKDSLKDDFFLSVVYEIVAAVSELGDYEQLEKFARFGAPYNVFVHARELVADITGKAYGKIALLPLINITDLGKQIQISTVIEEQNQKEKEVSDIQPVQTTDLK